MAKEKKIEDWQTAWNAATTDQAREQAVKDFEAAKLYNAELREQERLDAAVAKADRKDEKRKQRAAKRAELYRQAGVAPSKYQQQMTDAQMRASLDNQAQKLADAERRESMRLDAGKKQNAQSGNTKQKFKDGIAAFGKKVKRTAINIFGTNKSRTK